MNALVQTPVTLALLILNVGVSLYALLVDQRIIDQYSLKPYRVLREREYVRLMSNGFLHGNLAHLAFNMIALFFFGPWIETILGPLKFLIVYLGSLLAADALTMITKRNDASYASVGASGAISGVLFAFCLFAPLEKVYLFFALGIPSILFALLYVGLSIYAMKQGGGRIAHEAHLGGALGGLVLTMLLEPASITIFLETLRQL